MGRLIAILRSPAVLGFLGAVFAAALIALLGPLAGLDLPWLAVAAAVPFPLWGVALVLMRRRAAAAERRMVEGVTGGLDARAADEEVAGLRQTFTQSLALLKAGRKERGLGDGYLYGTPWYVIIGPPGAGKTTALVKSGLNFPLAGGEGAAAPLKGVGGTRQCDWWFADEAIFLDTAGRYTTQDSHEAVDQTGWGAFLKLLKDSRSRQPINGVLVAIAVPDLASADPAERLAHAAAIRRRLRELYEELKVKAPVYLLLTKSDLIAGFNEFFHDLNRDERKQILGVTLPATPVELDDGGMAQLGAGLDGIATRLSARAVDRIQQESAQERRGAIFAFPSQIASLKEPILDFVGAAFKANRYEPALRLRGVYFTSGTQEGTQIDRLIGGLSESFGIPAAPFRGGAGAAAQSRSYFLGNLLSGVVFREANLVGFDPGAERRRLWIPRIVYSLLALVTVGATAAWVAGYLDNSGLIDRQQRSVDAYRPKAESLTAGTLADDDLRRVLPVLNELRTLPAGHDTLAAKQRLALDFGLYQGDKLEEAGDTLYVRAVNGLMVPRLLVRVQRDLRDRLQADDAPAVEALLRLYLGLGGAGPVVADEVTPWLAGWLRRVTPPLSIDETRQAQEHLAAGLAAPSGLPKANLDAGLIRQAREVLLRTPLPARAYAAIVASAAAKQLPEWRLSDQAGPEGDRVFRRLSGARLSDGVPGLYTYQGFTTVVLPALPGAARSVRDLSWLLGPPRGEETGAELETEALTLYLRDYATRWDALLNDLALVTAANPQQLGEQVNILSGRTSPLQRLLAAVTGETTLQRMPEAPAGAAAAVPAAAVPAPVAALAGALGDTKTAKLVSQMVDDRFRALNDFTRGASGAKLEELLRSLESVHAVLSRLAFGQGANQKLFDAAASGGGEVFQRLATDMAYYPQPVRRWTSELVQQGTERTLSGARAQISAEWQSSVLPWCKRALDNRYPFTRGAGSDVGLDDFARLFAPGGLIDGFFTNRLRPFVDTTKEPWRWQAGSGDLGIPDSVLPVFQHAAMIRDAFFPDGGRVPSLRFELRPTYLGAGVEQVDLDVDGQRLTFARNATLAQAVQWPKPGGAGDLRVTFTGLPPELPEMTQRTGSWAWFRTLDANRGRKGGVPDRIPVSFGAGGKSVGFDVRMTSAVNPFSIRDLKEFRCPDSL
ncbi:type VI secretion system membrane subunit TssM [Azospirillum doebereinerae]|uniref:Type VI secretion system membrane subunit TssM n=1 Tax=Azospirillum doebereinerae TaxID=92933 RepID=A0A3S0WP38_9PROT|nr:type VI secretion system membrane subunit TssM [Azospirillum doebereinerae]RUQ74946.1 type VI secretion system membrane subunit TssM [Azospirillum doebereinerae]